MRSLLFLLLFAASLVASAQPAALVEGVQMPAWVQRGAERQPIVAGMVLQPGDVIETGPGSRLLVRMSERSLVKLGENGQLRFTELSPTKELFRAALHVFQGAFRFTTDIAQKSRRRDVKISVANVTAGIRGTDLWGRARDNTEVVCLIEGAIEVGVQGEPPLVMDQPRQFYRRVAGQTQPVGFVEPAQLDEWSKETEIERGRGAARVGGRFQATLARLDNQPAAISLWTQLRTAGYPAEIRPMKEGEQLAYIVRIRNLASAAEARALETQLRGKFQ
jgi:FecR-like protein/sporulation related protein